MKTHIFRLALVAYFFLYQSFSAQENKIAQFLNDSLKKDLALPDTIKYFDDTLSIIKPYQVEDGILSVELEIKKGGYVYNEKREIPLDEVEMVEKDLNIILIGKKSESVTVTTTEIINGKAQSSKVEKSPYFHTGIRIGKKNKIIGEHLQFYFAKTNRRISVGQWYD